MSNSQLRVGFGESDITPPHGLYMCGSLDPRKNEGTTDPLQSHALVVESGRQADCHCGCRPDRIAQGAYPTRLLPNPRAVPASRPTTLLSPPATRTAVPIRLKDVYSEQVTDAEYLSALPGRIGDSVELAAGRVEPASMYIGRSLVHHGIHNRRVICPDGKVMNTWMPQALNNLELIPQVLGTAGPVDPELWVVRFDRPDGSTIGILL